jgi:hypothetical protein
LNAQVPTNHGRPLKQIFIGIENEISLGNYPNCKEIKVESDDVSLSGGKIYPIYIARATKAGKGKIKVKRNGVLIETHEFEIVKIKERSIVAVTTKYGLLKSGTYAKEVIADIIAVKPIDSVYWLGCTVYSFDTFISKKPELFTAPNSGENLNSSILAQLPNLKPNDIVFFEDIKGHCTFCDDCWPMSYMLSFKVK